MTSLQNVLSAGVLIPPSHGYPWQLGLVGLQVASEAVLTLAYYLMAAALLYGVQRQDVPFRGLLWLFIAFTAASGTTHGLAIWALWFPTYGLWGGIKAFTALLSLGVAVAVIRRMPNLLSMPGPPQLVGPHESLSQEIAAGKVVKVNEQVLNQELEQRVARRTQALTQSQAAREQQLQKAQVVRSELEIALENLQDTTERLDIALSAARMGSWDWNMQQQQLYWSPKTEEILGFAPGTANPSYSAWAERVHPEDLPRVEAAIAQAQQTQQILSEDYRVVWPDQSVHWVLSQGNVISSPEGTPYRMIGVIQEITESKQAELALKTSESRFRAVFEQAAVGMARLSAAGHWLQVNQTLCDLLGCTASELIGQSFQAVTDPADLAQDAHYYQQLVQGKLDACRFEKRYLHKDGTPIWTMLTVSTERDEGGEVLAFIAVIEDIRTLKQALTDLQIRAAELESVNSMLAITTASLKDRNAELDQFAYVTSHDLKAPLRAIANLSEWIEEDLGNQLPAENQHQFSLLRQRVHRMEDLINGLLEYSRVGRQEQPVEAVAVDQLLAETIDLLSPPEAFTITVAAEMPTLTTHRIALSQVFANLISNAIKHRDRDDGQIQITAQDQGSLIEFAVMDDGPGIDPKYHDKVFTIFQTLKARDEFESTGIGLSVVKKIVESEGGTIWLKSSVGQGAAFHFTWPK
ncbi:MAG: PAS domain-containing protein [Leptolyngbya sp. SIO1E4]|nr:PAS domain-containing protein [Leptolyngbya sp. SIO1E4]